MAVKGESSLPIDIYGLMRSATDPVDSVTLSPSRVEVWERCKKKYYWRYYLRLEKLRKESAPAIGSLVGEALANYYRIRWSDRTQQALSGECFDKALEKVRPEFILLDPPPEEEAQEWENTVKSARRTIQDYHGWAYPLDRKFLRLEVEKNHIGQIAPNIFLQARPDGLVSEQELLLNFEHKCRGEYSLGDFNIDIQSNFCCLTNGAEGTYYNILLYKRVTGKFIRDHVMRPPEELEYYRKMAISIGEDILSTPPSKLYPMPIKRCRCDYWELCQAEIRGLDLNGLRNIYQISPRRLAEEEGKEV